VFSQEPEFGDTLAIMTVRASPTNESLSTCAWEGKGRRGRDAARRCTRHRDEFLGNKKAPRGGGIQAGSDGWSRKEWMRGDQEF